MRQGGLILAAGRVRSKKYKTGKKTRNSAAPKTYHKINSSLATAPLRDGVRRNLSHALAYTRPLRQIPGLWKSASYSSSNQ